MKKLIKSPIVGAIPPSYWLLSENKDENFAQVLKEVFKSYFNPTQNLSTNDFELNKNLIQFIFDGYNLGNIRLIYIQYESPTNYNFSELDILKNGDGDSLYLATSDYILNYFKNANIQGGTFGAMPLNILAKNLGVLYEFTDEALPKAFSSFRDKVDIVMYKPISNSDVLRSTPLWTMTHEILHVALDTRDEQEVQHKTFDTLYELGFYDDYSAAFFNYIASSRDNPYNIFNYVVDTLKTKDVALLNDILNTCYYALTDLRDNIDESYKPRIQGLIDEILSILGSNPDTPDGLDGILY